MKMDGEFIETPNQDFEVISLAAVEDVFSIPKTIRVPHKMASLKDAKSTIEEGGCTIWGQLPDIPYKFDKFGLGFTIEGQRVVHRARAGRSPFCTSNNGVNIIEDADSDYDFDSWIFPTIGDRLNN